MNHENLAEIREIKRLQELSLLQFMLKQSQRQQPCSDFQYDITDTTSLVTLTKTTHRMLWIVLEMFPQLIFS